MKSQKTKWVAAAVVLVFFLFVVGWRLGWFTEEPTYQGKTVTHWLDTIVLYDVLTNASGVSKSLRSSERLTNQAGFNALLSIGAKGTPVLIQRVMDLPEKERDLRLFSRWKQHWRETLERLRTGRKVAQKNTTYPTWQRQRKNVAGVILIALGTNAQGGFARYLEAYAAAPKPRVTGPILGVTPGHSARGGARLSAEKRAEVLAAVTDGMQHTNGEVRRAAASAAREFPDEGPRWKAIFLRLTQDTDPYAPHEALFALMRIPPDDEAMRTVEEITQDPAKPESTKEIARTVVREWDRVRGKAISPQ